MSLDFKNVVRVISVVVVATGICLYFFKRKKKTEAIPTKWKPIGRVSKLLIYPLKSGHHMEVDSAFCKISGLQTMDSSTNPLQLSDRSFIIFRQDNGEIKHCMSIPSLITIRLNLHDRNSIVLEAPGMEPHYLDMGQMEKNEIVVVKHWSEEQIQAIDCGEEVAKWVSRFIGQKDSGYRLGFYVAGSMRNIMKYQDRLKHNPDISNDSTGLFADTTSILMVNQASVDEFKKRAPKANVTAINFRPNIIIDGPRLQPFEEDNWKWLKVGNVVMRNVRDCTRCAITCVDPNTGVANTDREPITTLNRYRICDNPEGTPIMGIHLEVKNAGVIEEGDPIYLG